MTLLNATFRSDSTKSSLQRFGVLQPKYKSSKCKLYVHRGFLHIKTTESGEEEDIVLNVRGCRVDIVQLQKERNGSRRNLTSSDGTSLQNYAIEIVTHSNGT